MNMQPGKEQKPQPPPAGILDRVLGGPSRNEAVLGAFAEANGGRLDADRSAFGTMYQDQALIPHAAGVIAVRTGSVTAGRAASCFTELSFQFSLPLADQLRIVPDGVVRRVSNRLMNVKDIFEGSDPFDKGFSVSSSDRAFAIELLTSAELRAKILAFPSIQIDLKPTKENPAISSLQLKLPHEMVDVQSLTTVTNLAKTLIDRVHHLQSPNGMVEQALHTLTAAHPHLTSDPELRSLIGGQLAWAIHKETQVANETALNAPPSQLRTWLVSRAEALRTGKEADDPVSGRRGPNGWMKDPAEIVAATLARIESLAGERFTQTLRADLATAIKKLVTQEATICSALLERQGEKGLATITARTSPTAVVMKPDGEPLESRIHTNKWGEWYPGLKDDHLTLGEVYRSLPGFPADKVPEIIRLYENPESPVALPGAVTLLRHDLIHILLGRGLLDQDEAFVIGYTMGSCRHDLRASDAHLMEKIFSELYPEPYRIPYPKLQAFALGVEAGRTIGIENLARFPIENYQHLTIKEVREMLEIDLTRLRGCYELERASIPHTLESARLPI